MNTDRRRSSRGDGGSQLTALRGDVVALSLICGRRRRRRRRACVRHSSANGEISLRRRRRTVIE